MEVRLFSFRSTHDALKAEDALTRAQITARTIPKPRVINADCGLAIICRMEDTPVAEAAIAAASVVPVGSYIYVRGSLGGPGLERSDDGNGRRA